VTVGAGEAPERGFGLRTRLLGPLPVVNWFLARLGLARLLGEYLPCDDPRLRLAPATAIGVVVRNLAAGREPVYALGEWAAGYDPRLLGLAAGQAALLNDDRVGRALARLFDADRASLLTRLALGAAAEFGIETSRLHTDTTSIRFAGAYEGTRRARGGQPAPVITYGHSKDHRPDLKQLVWSLTVSADGAVPVCYRAADGNTTDDLLHIPAWDALTRMLGRAGFLYVADCKLASRGNMDHIHRNHGRFLTVLPASRAEDKQFRDWAAGHDPGWSEALRRPGRRHGDPDDVWWTCPAPWPSAEGYRIVWILSSAKRALDAEARRDKIARGTAALDHLGQRLSSPKARIRTIPAAGRAAADALDQAGAARWVSAQISEHPEHTFQREGNGRPGNDTRWRRTTRPRCQLTWAIRGDVVARDAATDGCFPLITNDQDMTPGDLLAAYKWQPNLEQRHHHLKAAQLVAPVFLHDPARIEALLCCHFIAMLAQALIERQTRHAMASAGISQLSLYPEDRGCAAPTAPRILNTFAGIARHELLAPDGTHIQTFRPQLTPLQQQVLNLLGIPASAYGA
jgi:hypothetical protein